MNSLKTQILHISGYIFILSLVLGLGFFFGTKFEAQKQTQTSYSTSKNLLKTDSSISTKVEIKEEAGVFWIKAGQSPSCPQSHPVKGTFDTNNGYFYGIDSKMYARVKPDICFASEDFAQNIAGFIKKF